MASDINSALPGFEGRKGGAFTFAAIFTLESFVRSLNVSVLPIQAFELLGSSRNVSVLTTFVSLAVLSVTLMMPYFFSRVRRRWAYTTGAVLMIGSALLLASHTVFGQVTGYFLRQAGASLMAVTLSLYILDHVQKADYARAEPIRLAVSTVAWTSGPFIGIWLYSNVGHLAPQLAVISAALLLLVVFWILRLSDPVTLPQGTLSNFNPLANVFDFAKQPRLRLAWLIAFMRSTFWSGYFIYGPIFVVESGLSKEFGGLAISASQLLLPLALVAGILARHWGVRPVVYLSFATMAASCAIAGVIGNASPYLVIGFLLIAAVGATGLDGVGAIPFMRAVRPRDRQRFTSVYRTFLESAEILPGFVFAIVLSFFPTSIVFIVMAVGMLVLCFLSWRYLPKSL
jgi:MFS family permease